ncbi:MAG: hypothetical protein EBV25_02885, partial [Methylophilaceae bacterium]|nr:hypothetical protein [Methylophilaceae bacterium]
AAAAASPRLHPTRGDRPRALLPPAADAIDHAAARRSDRRLAGLVRGSRGDLLWHGGDVRAQKPQPRAVELHEASAHVAGGPTLLRSRENLREPHALRLVERQVEHAHVVDLDRAGPEQIEPHAQRVEAARREIVDLQHELRPGPRERHRPGPAAHGREAVELAVVLHSLDRDAERRLEIGASGPHPEGDADPAGVGRREGIAADAIHGDKSQQERIQALDAFKQGKVSALIATDVAARGLDIDQLPMVINYEIPSAPEDYVHRIGRTGRAGALGEAISLVSPEEEKYLAEIEKLIKREIPKEKSSLSRPSSSRDFKSSQGTSSSTNKGSSNKGSKNIAAKSTDPWFDKPYEPTGSASNDKPSKPFIKSSSPKREVAALLGGLPRKS